MGLYMLATTRDNGDEQLLGFFDSQEALLAAIPEKTVLKIEAGRITPDDTAISKLRTYRVTEVGINTLLGAAEGVGEIDLPDACITITGDTGKEYGIALAGGKIVACTCPSFQYAKTDEPCKHMQRVKNWPSQYGLVVNVGRHSLGRPSFQYEFDPLPGIFYARSPR